MVLVKHFNGPNAGTNKPKGNIQFDDKNLKTKSWQVISHIPQEIVLMDDTIKNIALGINESEII